MKQSEFIKGKLPEKWYNLPEYQNVQYAQIYNNYYVLYYKKGV